MAPMPEPKPGWVRPERGIASLSRFMIWLTLRVGRPFGEAILPFITLYFLLTARQARRASRQYLARVLDRPVRMLDVARHFHTFAAAILDRVFFLSGRYKGYKIDIDGLDCVHAAMAGGRGCILLGAHIGSFEALRSVGRMSPFPVRVLMFRRNAGAPTRLLEQLAPEFARNIIDIGEPDAMIRVQESLARNELVGMLGDRAPGHEKSVLTPFLGGMAAFPAGPLLVASMLGVPVILFSGVRTGYRQYTVRFELLAEQITIPRRQRAQGLATWMGHYARWMERLCRAHPYNWFNFHDVWVAPQVGKHGENHDGP